MATSASAIACLDSSSEALKSSTTTSARSSRPVAVAISSKVSSMFWIGSCRVGALRGEHGHAVLLELLDDLVLGRVGLDDHQVGVRAEEGLQVGLAPGAHVGDVLRELLGGVPGRVALGIGDGHRGEAQGQHVLDLLPLQHRHPLGRLVELDLAAVGVGEAHRTVAGRGGVVGTVGGVVCLRRVGASGRGLGRAAADQEQCGQRRRQSSGDGSCLHRFLTSGVRALGQRRRWWWVPCGSTRTAPVSGSTRTRIGSP